MIARRSATQLAVMRTHSGSFRPRGAPGGEQEGRIRLDEQAAGGHERDDVGRRLLAGPEREPRDRDGEPEVKHARARTRPSRRRSGSRRAVDPRRMPRRLERPEPGGLELRDERVLGVGPAGLRANVEDRGLARLEREREVPPRFASWSGIGENTRS